MDTKPIKAKRPLTVDFDQLEMPSEADEAWADAWIARNREQIERDIAQARKSLAEGRGKTFSTPGQLSAYIMRRVRRRLAKEAKRK